MGGGLHKMAGIPHLAAPPSGWIAGVEDVIGGRVGDGGVHVAVVLDQRLVEVHDRVGAGGFEVHLENFSGPFDLLLSLISRHRLDITEVALAQVTDEFIAAVRAAEARDAPWDLGQLSEFLVVAATLLDLKAARLLPATDADDAEDLEMLEARDLLFLRLLQYRAFKEVATAIGTRLGEQARSVPRSVTLEPQLAALLPELVLQIGLGLVFIMLLRDLPVHGRVVDGRGVPRDAQARRHIVVDDARVGTGEANRRQQIREHGAGRNRRGARLVVLSIEPQARVDRDPASLVGVLNEERELTLAEVGHPVSHDARLVGERESAAAVGDSHRAAPRPFAPPVG